MSDKPDALSEQDYAYFMTRPEGKAMIHLDNLCPGYLGESEIMSINSGGVLGIFFSIFDDANDRGLKVPEDILQEMLDDKSLFFGEDKESLKELVEINRGLATGRDSRPDADGEVSASA